MAVFSARCRECLTQNSTSLWSSFTSQKDAVWVQISLTQVHLDPFPGRCGWDEVLIPSPCVNFLLKLCDQSDCSL